MPAIKDHIRSLARRATHGRACARWMAERPLLEVPTSNAPPFPQGLNQTDFDRVFRAQSLLFPVVLLGVPNVPVPAGVQVVALRWREGPVLDAAEAIDTAWPTSAPIGLQG